MKTSSTLLRERLMRANEECYETGMNRTAKIAILTAWEKQKNMGEKTAESIERLNNDVATLVSEVAWVSGHMYIRELVCIGEWVVHW